MRNKIFLSIFLSFTILTFSGCGMKDDSVQNNNNISNSNQESIPEKAICYDCGQGGWEKMDKRCDKEIASKNDFKNCLTNFSWSNVDSKTNADEMKNGYIEINSMEILDKPSPGSIKVIIYKQWAVDESGNLYLLGQLG